MSAERQGTGVAGSTAGVVEAAAGGTWVLVERAGSLWGVAGEAVARLAPGVRLLVRGGAAGPPGGELAADRVVAVVSGLAVRPVPRSLARWWGEPAAGLAVYGERPVTERAGPGAGGPAAAAAGEAASGAWVLVERAGSLWAVAGEAVARLAPGGRLRVRGGAAGSSGRELAADRVVAVVSGLAVRPVPRALARFWGEPAAGLAVYGGRPVVLVDPASPPAPLLAGAGPGAAPSEDEDGR